MELYLIRHGQATNNLRELPRPADPPLTNLGVEQAHRVGESLKIEGITRLYCSPMLRAVQTAQIISDILDLPPRVFVGLHEWGGIWEARGDGTAVQLPGLNRAGMREVCPDVILPDDITAQGWWFHEGFAGDIEGMMQLAHENGLAFIDHLIEYHGNTDQRVAAVSHDGSGGSLISAFFGLLPDVGYSRFTQNNTGVSKMSFTSERKQLLYLNRITHLPSEAITS